MVLKMGKKGHLDSIFVKKQQQFNNIFGEQNSVSLNGVLYRHPWWVQKNAGKGFFSRRLYLQRQEIL